MSGTTVVTLTDQQRYVHVHSIKINKVRDLKIICDESKKIINVHKSFLSANFAVFREMLERNCSEVIRKVDEVTLWEMVHYIYTGEPTGRELNIGMVALVADRYDLPGMMDLLCMRTREELADGGKIDISARS